MSLLAADYVNVTIGGVERSVPRFWEPGGACVVDRDFKPYCYIPSTDAAEAVSEAKSRGATILSTEWQERKTMRSPVKALKVTCGTTMDVVKVRNAAQAAAIPVAEADIPYHLRATLDKGIVPGLDLSKLRVAALDFEVYNDKGLMGPGRGRTIIASLAWEDKGALTTEVLWDEGGGEVELLGRLARRMRSLNQDLWCGYNSNGYDWPHWLRRCKELRVPFPILGRDGSPVVWGHHAPNIAGIAAVDLYSVVDRDFAELKDKSLKAVADKLGVLKRADRVIIAGRDISKAWDHDRDRLLAYAADDARATLLLAKLLLPSQMAMADLLHVPLQDACHASRGRQCEFYMMQNAVATGTIIPAKPLHGDVVEKEEGGYVMEPVHGLHENVEFEDIAGTYPAIIVANNVSEDSYCDDTHCGLQHHIAPFVGHRFHHFEDKMGFISNMTRTLVTTRKPLKKRMKSLVRGTPEHTKLEAEQDSLKRIANCFSGDTFIMTASGARNIRDIRVGDLVWSINPRTLAAEAGRVYDAISQSYRGPMVSFRSEGRGRGGIDFTVTPNHRMLLRPWGSTGPFTFIAATDAMKATHGWEAPRDAPGFASGCGIMPEHITEAPPPDDGMVYCVGVADNHTVLAGRTLGQLQWTGNSFYGIANWQAFRWHFPPVTGAITAWGRYYITEAARIAREDFGLEVLASDTDSLAMKSSPRIAEFREHVNGLFPVEFEHEGTFPRIFLLRKKRYFGIDSKGEQKVRGIEVRRGDWCKASQRAQQACIDALLETPSVHDGVGIAVKAVRREIRAIQRGDFNLEDVVIRKRITQHPDDYVNPQAHVQAAVRSLGSDVVDFIDASVEYVMVRGRSERVCDRSVLLQDLDSTERVDRSWYVESQIIPAALRVLDDFGVTRETLLGQERLT